LNPSYQREGLIKVIVVFQKERISRIKCPESNCTKNNKYKGKNILDGFKKISIIIINKIHFGED
jgi:hypothetical protein